jgi:2-methylisocitrate lyase-like PEP mutase family enzyme
MASWLDQLLTRTKLLVAPGVYDGLSATIAADAGFEVLYASGGAIARSTGVPDLGLLSMTEVRDRMGQICAAVDVPVIADIDTGYGNALNVFRTVRQFISAGVAGLQIEDQVAPKRCGHYAGTQVIPAEEMEAKVRAAVDARGDADVAIVARTDAIASHGLAEAIERAWRYHKSGADVIFVEAPQSVEQIREVADALRGVTLLINMFEGGRTPAMSPEELADLGFRIVIIPSDLQRGAIRAMQSIAAEIRTAGSSQRRRDELATFQEREQVVRKPIWDEMERRYSSESGRS